MRIAAIETRVVNAEMRNWVFVKVVTDDPGLFGWGEATLECRCWSGETRATSSRPCGC
jgi:L-alanine-DL-glutamate epimerase-like enolase superfamily enzyme